jgi:hypothetical protein
VEVLAAVANVSCPAGGEMIKYETINGTLCRMVEPEPLTPEANFPCVVRLIQDDSPMGKLNKKQVDYYYGVALKLCLRPVLVKSIDDGSKFDTPWEYCRYEIIGYPVADGSLEWALYQIRSGKKVVKEGGGKRYGSPVYENRLFYLNGSGCLVTKNAIGLIDPCSEEEFLSLDETGWQLYTEPKPEPERSPTAH